jgi:hypothetical protein
MKLSSLVSAAILATAAPAFAAAPGDLGTLDNSSAAVGRVVGSGLFVDTYTFTLNDPGMVFGGAFSNFVSGFQVELFGEGFTSFGVDANPTDGFSFEGLGAGSYALQFAGFSTSPVGVYGGTVLAATAPIPEPETYAMLLAGLLAVGFVARRRQS